MKIISKLKTRISSNKGKLIPYIIVLTILLLSIGYSAFSSKINISNIVADVRIKADIRVTGVNEAAEDYICALVDDADSSGTVTVGDEYLCNVDGTNKYTFYVLSTSGDNISLMMNSSITSTGVPTTSSNNGLVAWLTNSDYTALGGADLSSDSTCQNLGVCATNAYGPVTAMNYLYNATKNWTNIPDITMNYTDEGGKYGGIKTSGTTTSITKTDGTVTASYENLKARLPNLTEMSAICTGSNYSSCPSWVSTNMNLSYYWLSTSGSTTYYAYNYYRSPNQVYPDYITIKYNSAGVRPVINVSTSDIESGIYNNGGTTTYTEYNVSNISAGINLPNEYSSVTFKVYVTNIGNAEMAITDITGLPDNLEYELLDYELKEKICNSNDECSLGITKEITIRVKYASGGYDSSNTSYNITLDFDFQPFYSVTAYSAPCKLISGSGTDAGDEYLCNVDGTNEYTFYVLSTDGDNINLIMDHDLSSSVAWISSDDYNDSTNWGSGNTNKGPITAMNYLYNATKDWTNIPNIEMDYTDEGGYYGGIKTNGTTTSITKTDGTVTATYENLKARMPTRSELSANCTGTGSTCPSWVGIDAYMYWASAAMGTNSAYVYYSTANSPGTQTGVSSKLGVRPVISISSEDVYLPTTNVPSDVLAGETLEIDFGDDAPLALVVKIDGVEISNYTYKNGVLTIANVSGNVEIKGKNIKYSVTAYSAPCELVSGSGTDAGDEYLCNVDGTNEYTFYVLSTSGDTVNLIMNSDISSDGAPTTSGGVFWLSNEDYTAAGGADLSSDGGNCQNIGVCATTAYGPITAMDYLYSATKNWTNIPDITMNYTDESGKYGGIKTSGTTTSITKTDGTVTATYENLKARLPNLTEMSAVCTGSSYSSCPSWVSENAYMYWLSTSSSSNANYAYVYYSSPNQLYAGPHITGKYNTSTRIRPVISVSANAAYLSTTNVPSEVIAGRTLKIDFGDDAPFALVVKIDGVEISNYTYEDGVLTIPNVSGNVEISGENVTISDYLTDLYTPNSTVTNNSITYNVDTTNSLINDRLGGTTSNYNSGNIRYYGASPSNYIDIGDRDSSGNVILWRIIGVFKNVTKSDGTTADLVKVVRNSSIGTLAWDYTSSAAYNSNWADATLKTLLNGAYYNSTSTSYYNGSTTATTLSYSSTGLSSSARSKVQSVVWNLGGLTSYNVYTNVAYTSERGTTTNSSNSTTWTGKVALMHPSDYGYATDFSKCSQSIGQYNSSTNSYACRTNDWLYVSGSTQWLINPYNTYSYYAMNIYSTGYIYYSYAYTTHIVRPTLYLSSSVKITGGTGTSSDPYVVE